MRQGLRRGALSAAALALVVFLLPEPASAQLTTATLRGRVTDDAGAPLGGVAVTATNTETGVSRADVSGADGYYTLGGLVPGSYLVQISSPNFAPQSRNTRLLVGQTLEVDFQLATQVTATETVVVEGEAFVETKTSEVTTHVTEEQIDNLPQSNRNFLNFAALAPGVRTKRNEFDERQEVASGALGASEINVFIDGVSFKSDVLQGGVIGQDASRGNPFPQNAVQEYEILTNNYKAEYETAASAIISAVTKSGSNALHGDVFGFYQDKDLVDEDEFVEMRRENDSRCPGGPAQICDEAEYERYQYGLAIGGPIVPDRAHFFLSYEGNRQDRSKTVFLGGNRAFFGGNLPARITDAEGNFVQPFRSSLYYGKVSFQAASSHSLEFSGNIRHETDLRGFGEQIGIEAAENVKIDTGAAILKHQWVTSSWMNQATLSYNHLKWNPTPENISTVGEEFEGLIRLGGRDTEQDFRQDKISFRDDLSYFFGSHSLKGGVILNFAQYEASKLFEVNPRFFYRSDISSEFPYRARWGSGNPNLDADNTQIGLYIQDDWAATPRLTLNLGLRWDYETDMINNDYETPALVRSTLAGIVDEDRYFTDGNQRDPYTSAFQPRVGIAYDFFGNGRTVGHAGYGIYYDRTLYNDTLDERFRLQWTQREFLFSATGAPRDGAPTIAWRPEYLTREGLQGLIASGRSGEPEVFLVANDTEPLRSQQYSIGLRQAFGAFVADVSYVGIRSEHGFTWLWQGGRCCIDVPNFSNVLISSDDRKTWYDAIFVTVNKPYTASSKWAASLAYTYGEADQIGGDLFSLDFPTVEDYPRHPTSTDERHRVVLSALAGLPWQFRISTLLTLGSGFPYNIDDATRGFGPGLQVLRRNAGEPPKEDFIIPNAFAYRTLDLRLEKDFTIGPGELGLIAEVFNVFDYENYGCFDGFTGGPNNPNPRFNQPGCLVEPGRRLQFGVRYGF
jgi:hypothetical protein